MSLIGRPEHRAAARAQWTRPGAKPGALRKWTIRGLRVRTIRGADGEQDLFLYDRVAGRLLATPDLNTTRDEFDPAIVELK